MSARQVGRYELRAVLGKGARGVVFAGADTGDARPVAVKMVPREHVDEAGLAAYAKLLPTLRTLDHDGIARPLDLVETPTHVALVSAVAPGDALATRLGPAALDVKAAWDLMSQVFEALAVAHVHGVVHRDLKASNVVVHGSGRAILVDTASALVYKQPPANVDHFAPEHFGQGKVGARSDIYQAGLLAYRLVCGRVPFSGSYDEVRHRVLDERPSDPSSFDSALAWQLDWVVQKALAKDPAERYGSVLDFAEGLRLGLQDTWGRPLEPVKVTAPQAPTGKPAGPATLPLRANARAIAAVAEASAAAKPGKAAVAAAKSAPATPASPEKPTLLFVDDDPRILAGLKALFRDGVNTIAVDNGAEALDVIGRTRVHVIVSDQRMPQMTGVALLRQVRKISPNTVRVLLTGYTDLASLVGSINEGEIFRFVKKPWDNDQLRQAIMESVALARESDAVPPLPVPAPRTAGSLLVIDPAGGLARGLQRLLAGDATVKVAASVQEAAKMLGQGGIAVVVADKAAGMEGLTALFHELRRKRPYVLSILITDEPDAEAAIDLVNRAQIFRFLPKPVSARELRTQVAEALRRHAALKQAAAKVAASNSLAASANLEGARPGGDDTGVRSA